MSIDLVLKIAAIGIIVTVLGQVLKHEGHEEMATMSSIAGLVIVLIVIVDQLSKLFSTIKTVFGL